MEIHQDIGGAHLLEQLIDPLEGVGTDLHPHLALQVDDAELPAQLIQNKHSTSRHAGVVVRWADDAIFLLQHRVNLPPF